MNRLMKENVEDVSVGNSFFRAPEREFLNSYSKPLREIDKYYQISKTIGKLNPKLDNMKI